MAIEKNSLKVSRLDSEFSSRRREGMSSEEDEVLGRGLGAESDGDEVFDECDSGVGSDDCDLLELGEVGEEFCQVGDQTCSIPLELYDLSGLGEIISMDAWNDCLTEEERFRLAEFLPDMDQETFLQTLKQLFTGSNLHFGSPLAKLFDMMKGGLCEPRVALYRQGLMYFQKRQHCHFVRKYHNTMVVNLHQIRDAWLSCSGYSINEKLQVLKIVKSQKSFTNKDTEELGATTLQNMCSQYSLGTTFPMRDRIKDKDNDQTAYVTTLDKSEPLGIGKKNEVIRNDDYNTDYSPSLMQNLHYYGEHGTVDKLSDIKVLTSKLSKTRKFNDIGKKVAYPVNVQQFSVEEQMKYRTSPTFNEFDPFWQNTAHQEVFSAGMSPVYGDDSLERKKWKIGSDSSSYKFVGRLNFPEFDAKLSLESRRYSRCEETESESSEPIDEDEDNNPLMISKLVFPRENLNGSFINHVKIGQKGNKGGARTLEELSQLRVAHDQRRVQKFGKKMRLQGAYSGAFDVPPQKSYPTGRKQNEKFGHFPEYDLDNKSIPDIAAVASFGKKVNKFEYFHEVNHVPLSLLKSKVTKVALDKQDGNGTNSQQQLENKEASTAYGVQETRSQKKPFTLITPTVHSGFSFSIVHLLSAVRIAMVTVLPEDSLEIGGINGVDLNKDLDMNKSEPSIQYKVPSLTVQEIVTRVRSNPEDPCILETQEPLEDLIRGVLKIFSSKAAPLGAKRWKSLASYERSTKTWSWTGPISHGLPDYEVIEEVTSPETWLLPHNMLVKLVDAFANWLKSCQETLRQIGSLPNPPLSLMQFNADEKERFRDLRAQKSPNTISPITEDIRNYFRKEEYLRYSIPDRAFSYTAIDGKKSFVAPLRRCGGKLNSKARDHFMLKRDRPPHVTILCLVRDAAARLPGSIGTRADICTLIRDSQYIVEDVSDAQVNQVVSGAMDRLHYELDPCVQYDGERKLWVYLHRDRDEEDFEDDGTSSTKKWKRQKKEVPGLFVGGGEQIVFDLGSDLNAKPSHRDEYKAIEPPYYDGKHRMEDNMEIGNGSELGAMQQSSTMAWESLGLNSKRENRFVCQENSQNDDFGDERFVQELPDEFRCSSL